MIVFFSLGVFKYVVCLCMECDGCFFSVCIVRCGVACARAWEVFRHVSVVCSCLVLILWQLSMLRSAWLAFC